MHVLQLVSLFVPGPIQYIMRMQHSDMNEEMRVEAMELCVTACEKHAASNEVCSYSNNYVMMRVTRAL